MDPSGESKMQVEDVEEKDPPPAYQGPPEKKDPMEGLTQKEKDLIEEMKGLQWSEFTQNTTFHGVKYIFETTPVRGRRFLWVLVVVSSIAFFTSMVGIRTQQYLKHETNIALELKFEDQVPFPAVTLCNQNSFRMTKVIEMGLYHVIDDIYSMDDFSHLTHPEHANLSLPADVFLRAAGHTLDDLIDKCTWMGEKCDVAKDFAVTFTEFGVCYTFNGDLEAVKFVDDTSRGLSLILNVEQYEHMRGPQNDAGVKMLLHSQGETPLMKDQGFAVSPGSHILAAVSMTRTLSMEPPWGTCSETAPATSDCKNTFRSNHFLSACNCKQQFMNTSAAADNITACTLGEHFSCIITQDWRAMKVGSDQCTVPCNVTVYEPSLSSAQLSAINIERLVLTNRTKQSNVKLHYLQALEALQRVNRFIVKDDEAVNKSLMEKAADLSGRLAPITEAVGETSEMAELLTSLSAWIPLDEINVRDLKHGLQDIVIMEKGYIENCEPIYLTTMESYFANGLLSALIECTENVQPTNVSLPMYSIEHYEDHDVLEKCLSSDSSGESSSGESFVSSEGPDSGEDSTVTKSPEEIEKYCRNKISNRLDIMTDAYMYSNATINYLHNLKSLYMSTVHNVFDDTHQNFSEVEEHAACVLALDELHASMDIMSQAQELMRAALEAENYTALTAAATQLNDLLADDPFGNLSLTISDVESACWWMESAIDKHPYEHAKAKFMQALTEGSKMEEQRASLEELLGRIEQHFSTRIAPVIGLTEDYLAGKITKLDMAINFTSSDFSTAIMRLMAYDGELATLLGNFQTTAGTFKVYLTSGYEFLFDLMPPVMNASNIRSFNVIQYAGQNHTADGDLQLMELWDELDGRAKEDTVNQIIATIVEKKFLDHYEELAQNIRPLISTLNHLAVSYASEMTAYGALTRLTTPFLMENFLQVDVFYKDVSFETISQREAFALSSLFGEVGGFLGLLLGASIITVCELLDYIAMVCLKRCKTRKQTVPGAWQAHTRS